MSQTGEIPTPGTEIRVLAPGRKRAQVYIVLDAPAAFPAGRSTWCIQPRSSGLIGHQVTRYSVVRRDRTIVRRDLTRS